MASASSTFDDPAENPLSESSVWDSGPGSWQDVQKGVTSGQVEATATGSCGASYKSSVVAFSSDQESEVTIGFEAWAGQVVRGGPVVRMQGTGANQGDCYGFLGDDAVPNIRLYRIDDASGTLTYTQLGSSVAETPVAGDTLKVSAVGSTIKGYRNGVEKISVTDSTYTGGQPGFVIDEGSYSPAGLRFTAWQAADVSSGPGAGADSLASGMTESSANLIRVTVPEETP